mmetsp:Transcript_11456/g.34599  ORF Transcript_11456/g.34599 Transcript_11456/m.34599 type:complete len:210 (-) Transcript_11456:172-801(-)
MLRAVFSPAECRTQPSCQATSPSSRASSCTTGAVRNQASSQPQSDAKSLSRKLKERRCVPTTYCSVPISRPMAASGIQACTDRRSGCALGSPTASSSRCQCVSGSPGSLEKPRSMRRQSSLPPANSCAARHSRLSLPPTKAATSGSSSCTSKVKRTSFWPSLPPKARRPCANSRLRRRADTRWTSVEAKSPRVMTCPLLPKVRKSSCRM